ncbi:MAG: endonuclease/exonuclease/phosphatase family protein [Gammaproteobacteria bacterium]|nr:endonuclease/exonuclease/phosphatase family protein [Gammaproteobacteria bacterium]
MDTSGPETTLRFLTYNIQTGYAASSYADYVTRGWQHVLPNNERFSNLRDIGRELRDFDIVGLQEIDTGSFRTGSVNLTHFLAAEGEFPYWNDQTTRRVAHLARCGNGILSRLRPTSSLRLQLPGLPGRGAILSTFNNGLTVVVLHLALDALSRARQMDFIAERLVDYPEAIVMGDFNCGDDHPTLRRMLARTGLRTLGHTEPTFPSWRPTARLDHVLLSPGLEVRQTLRLNWTYSDHLPVGVEIALPGKSAPRQAAA